MADRALTAKHGGAANPDDCVVVVRSEVLDELISDDGDTFWGELRLMLERRWAMADRALTAKHGGAANPDDCVVVVRSEVLDELMRAHRATDRLAFREGLVGGMIAAALVVGVAWLCGWIGADGPRLVAALAFGGFVVALWYRIWDASACSVTLMGWELKDFAASLYKQGMEEARGGRADG